jgi:sugar-specific transcriptional regulator TrmB
MQYLKSLQKLGFNQHEQDVYFALLQLEKATANEIAYKAKTKRPTTYDILYRLRQQGFIAETYENKKRYFIANPPENLLEIIESRKRELKDDLPELLGIFNTKARKPKVEYFEGLDGIIQLYEDTLGVLEKGDELLAYVGNYEIPELDKYMHDYVIRRAKKGIRARGIAENKPGIKEFTRENKAQLRVTKLVSESEYNLKNEINIYANKVFIISFKPELFGVLIESKEVADTQRAIFEMAWRGISRESK